VSEPSSSERLKRNIFLVHLVGIEIGLSIGAGIFALTGLGLARTGPSLPLAFLAAVNRRFGTPHPANSLAGRSPRNPTACGRTCTAARGSDRQVPGQPTRLSDRADPVPGKPLPMPVSSTMTKLLPVGRLMPATLAILGWLGHDLAVQGALLVPHGLLQFGLLFADLIEGRAYLGFSRNFFTSRRTLTSSWCRG
jgi:hypothetical protein